MVHCIYVSRGVKLEFPNYDEFLSIIVFIFGNSVYPDEILQCKAFHLGLHCLVTHLWVSSIRVE